jgi:tRNA (cmo5U34)-methyltransferase
LRTDYPIHGEAASVTLCVLTLQFTPIEYRLRILDNIWRSTVPGGAVILVEKVIGSLPDMDRLLVDLYYKLKADNGYTVEEIERKRLALEGVLVPVSVAENERMLGSIGFRTEMVWRFLNFCAWIGVKP